MTRASISKRQRQILSAMRHHDGIARFGASEMRGFNISLARVEGEPCGGVSIFAYQQPEIFLEGRGLIERIERNAPGRWFRLTEAGADLARRIRAETRQ